MRQINILYESEKQFKNQIAKENFIEENLLVFLFSDESITKIKEIIKDLQTYLPNTLIAGSSSGGIIHEGHSLAGQSVITFLQFEKIKPKGILLSLEDYSSEEMALEIKKKIHNEESKLLFLFNSGVNTNPVKLLEEISTLMPNLPLAGGSAGNIEYYSEETYIFLNDEVIKNGAVAITLNGEYLRIFQNYRLNWQKIGKKMKVTEAEGNILKSVDGIPILDLYEKYMGKEFVGDLVKYSGIEFPFILKREGMDIARSLMEPLPDGRILYHGDIRIDEEVQFSYGHVPNIINDVEKEYNEAIKFQPQGILIFSCFARKKLLGQAVDNELLPFEQIIPTSGFFTFGEFFHRENKNFLLNITMTLLMLSEEPENNKIIVEKYTQPNRLISKNHQLNVIETLIRLVDQVSSELEERNALLNHLSYTDSLTGLYNQRFFKEALEHETMRALRYNNKLSVAILDIDNFKEINDSFGHSVGDMVLSEIAFKIEDSCRDTDIVCRYGGDEIVIILLETDIERAKEVCERISQNIYRIDFMDKDIKVTLSIGIAELSPKEPEKILKKADERLYKAKKKGKNNIICEN